MREFHYGSRSARRPSTIAGMAVTIVLHGLGLWFLLHRAPVDPKTAAAASQGGMTIFVAPLAAGETKPSKKSDDVKKRGAMARRTRMQPPAITVDPAPIVAAQPDVAQRDPAPADDMLTQLEAARKRRADAANERAAQAGNEPSQDNKIALANIAAQMQSAGVGRDHTGGIFQIRNQSSFNAEFLFRGWNRNFRRNWSQLIAVNLGAESDIQIAIVKKMIEIIRNYEREDFVWDSHRLGRSVTLSARLEDSVELQQFLMREFFPDYVSSTRR